MINTILFNSLRDAGRRLARTMEERPILSNSIVCLKLWVAGDLLAQSYEHDPEHKYNLKRTCQVAAYGAVVSGPLYAAWYPYLDRKCIGWNLAKYGVWSVPIAKVVIDEFIMDPPTISMFFAYMTWCQNDMIFNWELTKQKIKAELPRAWVTSLVTWPAVLVVTFRFVPTHFQTAVVNTCAVVWDGFLSHRNAVATGQQKKSEHEVQTKDAALVRVD